MTYDVWLRKVGEFLPEPGLINRAHVWWPRKYNAGLSPEEAYKAAMKAEKGDFLIWGQQ